MDRNVLNDIVNILCANIEKVHEYKDIKSITVVEADNSIQSCFISECGNKITISHKKNDKSIV